MNKYEIAREKEIARIMNFDDADSGKQGKIFELQVARKESTKTRVADHSRTDLWLNIDGQRAVEVKTNGGRIESLYKLSEEARKTTFVIYRLDIMIKAGKPRKDGTCKPAEHRVIEPILCTAEYFLNTLESAKAVKTICHNELDRERAIQADSKKLYELLREYPIPYSKELKYTMDDFEGLE